MEMENIMKSAIETMEKDLKKNQRKQSLCLDKFGLRIRNDRKYEYQQLVIEARELHSSIRWWKKNICN